MKNDYPYHELLRISKECRTAMVDDILNNSSNDLYDAMYADPTKEIFETKIELYETKCLERCWDKINESISQMEYSIQSSKEKREYASMMLIWFQNYIKNWNYTKFDAITLRERINILKSIISVNSGWEENLKRMSVSFERSEKILTKRIEALKRSCD